jgi:hypothetical protein
MISLKSSFGLDRVETNVEVHRRLDVTVAQKLPDRLVLAGMILEENRRGRVPELVRSYS